MIKDTFRSTKISKNVPRDQTDGISPSASPSSLGVLHRSAIGGPSTTGVRLRNLTNGSSSTTPSSVENNQRASEPPKGLNPTVHRRRIAAFTSAPVSADKPYSVATRVPNSAACLRHVTAVTGAPSSSDKSSSSRHYSTGLDVPASADYLTVAPRVSNAANHHGRNISVSTGHVPVDNCNPVASRATTPAGVVPVAPSTQAANSAINTAPVVSTLQLFGFIMLQVFIFIMQQHFGPQLLQFATFSLLKVAPFIIQQSLGTLLLGVIIILPDFLLWMIVFLSRYINPLILKDQWAWSSCRCRN